MAVEHDGHLDGDKIQSKVEGDLFFGKPLNFTLKMEKD
jgi:hypothetical protein